MRSGLRWVGLAVLAACATPAWGAPCPPPNATNNNCVQVTIPMGATASQIITEIMTTWNGGDFQCNPSIANGMLTVIVSGGGSQRTFHYVLSGNPFGTATAHTIRLQAPRGAAGSVPFDAFASFAGGSEATLGEGSNGFSLPGGSVDIRSTSVTVSNRSAVPALGGATVITAVAALLLAGALLILLRASS
jgi:hypothetical protein